MQWISTKCSQMENKTNRQTWNENQKGNKEKIKEGRKPLKLENHHHIIWNWKWYKLRSIKNQPFSEKFEDFECGVASQKLSHMRATCQQAPLHRPTVQCHKRKGTVHLSNYIFSIACLKLVRIRRKVQSGMDYFMSHIDLCCGECC